METTEINKLPNTFQQNIDVNNSSQNYYSEKNQKQHADLPERDRIIDPEQLTRDENTKVNLYLIVKMTSIISLPDKKLNKMKYNPHYKINLQILVQMN